MKLFAVSTKATIENKNNYYDKKVMYLLFKIMIEFKTYQIKGFEHVQMDFCFPYTHGI